METICSLDKTKSIGTTIIIQTKKKKQNVRRRVLLLNWTFFVCCCSGNYFFILHWAATSSTRSVEFRVSSSQPVFGSVDVCLNCFVYNHYASWRTIRVDFIKLNQHIFIFILCRAQWLLNVAKNDGTQTYRLGTLEVFPSPIFIYLCFLFWARDWLKYSFESTLTTTIICIKESYSRRDSGGGYWNVECVVGMWKLDEIFTTTDLILLMVTTNYSIANYDWLKLIVFINFVKT